jgi:hypothetical protein
MIYSSILDDEKQYSTGSLVVHGWRIVDYLTGEILCDLSNSASSLSPELVWLRKDIDWNLSLKIANGAIDRLLEAYRVIYPDYPEFIPGFAKPKNIVPLPAGDEDSGTLYRGLSNSNKVQKVIIKNTHTGELIEIDKTASRLSRMRRRVFSWANTIKDYLPASGVGLKHRKVMITLTYQGVDDWRPNHIRDYTKELKRRLGTNLIALAWVAELQERGAVHYHLELIVKKGTRIPKPDTSGMWKHGMSRIETAKTVFYICSYLKKAYQKEGIFPKGLRMFGVWVSPACINDLARWLFRLSTLPRWLCDQIKVLIDHYGEKWERFKGGGYVFAGRLYRSPFRFLGWA